MPLTVIPASGGGTGTSFPGATPPLFVNSNQINVSYTIAANSNALSAGPLSIANGVTVSIPNGSRWVIL